MQIVIDIDENVFTRLFDNGIEDYEIVNDDLFAIAKAIRKGTVLENKITSTNLCNSCTNIGCEFQSGIVRTKCAFYIPPHIEPDNCGNYVVMQPTVEDTPKDQYEARLKADMVTILDKIRTEIEEKCCITVGRENDGAITLHDVFEIIDKYKAEEREQIPDTRRIRILPPENILKLKEYVEWLPQYEGELVAESEESMIRSRQMANKLSQNIIEHARRLYPEAIGYKGQLTNEQFCEIEKECDIDVYKFGRQDPIYKIRYKGGG